jgi:hypothetical protein
MVSWFRFLAARWSIYKDQLKPNGNPAAIWTPHESFMAIKTTHKIDVGFNLAERFERRMPRCSDGGQRITACQET